jgi:hypothetical protein
MSRRGHQRTFERGAHLVQNSKRPTEYALAARGAEFPAFYAGPVRAHRGGLPSRP